MLKRPAFDCSSWMLEPNQFFLLRLSCHLWSGSKSGTLSESVFGFRLKLQPPSSRLAGEVLPEITERAFQDKVFKLNFLLFFLFYLKRRFFYSPICSIHNLLSFSKHCWVFKIVSWWAYLSSSCFLFLNCNLYYVFFSCYWVKLETLYSSDQIIYGRG